MKKEQKIYIAIIITVIVLVGSVLYAARWRVVSVGMENIFDIENIAQIDDCQNVVVLGAQVRSDGSMSKILAERAMAALDLYGAGKACRIIISGDARKEKNYTYDEVTPVKEYLLANGVPEELIIVDGDGYDTFASMRNVHDKFGVDRVVVVTQRFHLPRALYIGHMLGMDVTGFVAYRMPYTHITKKWKDELREWPAAVKAVWQSEIIN